MELSPDFETSPERAYFPRCAGERPDFLPRRRGPLLFLYRFQRNTAPMGCDNSSLMRLFERRALTPGEIALGRSLFGDEIAWVQVRIMQLPAWGFWAMVPMGRTILYAKLKAWRDFATAPVSEQGIFVHELTHVWQAARGMVLAFAKLGALGRGAYVYRARPNAKLCDYNIEAQAEIARHLHESRVRAPDKNAPPLAWLEEIWARRWR